MKHKTFFALSVSILALATFFAANLITGNTFLLAHADYDPTTLNLDSSKQYSGLPAENTYTNEIIEQQLNSSVTMQFYNASKKSDHYLKLNAKKSASSEPSYFMKKEISKGLISFSTRVTSGKVDVLVGFEENVFLHKYSIDATGGAVELTKTVRGNYFKVINDSYSHANVKYFNLSYDCRQVSEDLVYSFDSSTGKYNSNREVGTRELADVLRMTTNDTDNINRVSARGGTFNSTNNQYSLVSGAKIWLSHFTKVATDAHLVLMLSNSTVQNATLTESLDLYLNDTHLTLPTKQLHFDETSASSWYEYDCGLVTLNKGANSLCITSLADNGLLFGYSAMVDHTKANNAAVDITTSSTEYDLARGTHSVVCGHPGTWYYLIDKSSNVRASAPIYDNGSVYGTIGYLSGTGDNVGKVFLRYQPFQWVSNVTVYYSLQFTCNFTGSILVAGTSKNVTAGVVNTLNGSFTIKQSESFTISIRQITIPETSGGLVYELSNANFYSSNMTQGAMSDVAGSPNHWYYHANGGSKNFAYKESDETKAGFSISPSGSNDYYLRFYLLGTFQNETYAVGDGYRMTFDLYSPVSFNLLIQITNLKDFDGYDNNTVKNISISAGWNTGLYFDEFVRTNENSNKYVIQFIFKSTVVGFVGLDNVVVTKNAA